MRAEVVLTLLMLPPVVVRADAPVELQDKQGAEAYANKVAGDFLAIVGGTASLDPDGWGKMAEDAAHEPNIQQHHWHLFFLYSAKVFYSGSNTPTANAAIQRIDTELASL